MNNNKGFIFLETIIITVVLTTTLIFLYSNFSKNINDEKRRLYYDDIAYVYKTIFIRNAVKSTINNAVFEEAINDDKADNQNSLKNNFVFLFNSESKFCTEYFIDTTDGNKIKCEAKNYRSLYFDNKYISDLNNIYKFKTLVYLKNDDISKIKKCINSGIDSFEDTDTDKKRCQNFLEFTNEYSEINLNEYMLTINSVDTNAVNPSSQQSIMIAIFNERKNGNAISFNDISSDEDTIPNDSYKSCLNYYINKNFNCPDCDLKTKIENYYDQDIIRYNMACEKAYYVSWVYYE
mgnify:FL=1